MDDLETMAREFYGFGRWSAPYWFIGLEQGGSDNHLRALAFKELQSDGLCDCKEFHSRIKVTDWHGKNADLQKTWGRLMMFLASFRGVESDKASLLSYQREHWGGRESDTCVIELNGLSAAGLHIKVDRRKYLAERVTTIRRKLTENNPRLVVMYGFTGRKHFEEIAGCDLFGRGVIERQRTLFVFVDHPARQRNGNTDLSWRELGTSVRVRPRGTRFRCEAAEPVIQEVLKRPTTSHDGTLIFSGTALRLWKQMKLAVQERIGLSKARAITNIIPSEGYR